MSLFEEVNFGFGFGLVFCLSLGFVCFDLGAFFSLWRREKNMKLNRGGGERFWEQFGKGKELSQSVLYENFIPINKKRESFGKSIGMLSTRIA